MTGCSPFAQFEASTLLSLLVLIAKQRQVRTASPADDEKRRVINNALLTQHTIIQNRSIAPAHPLKCLVAVAWRESPWPFAVRCGFTEASGVQRAAVAASDIHQLPEIRQQAPVGG